MTLVQTSDGSSFAFTSASFYPIPGQSWFTMEVRARGDSLPASRANQASRNATRDIVGRCQTTVQTRTPSFRGSLYMRGLIAAFQQLSCFRCCLLRKSFALL